MTSSFPPNRFPSRACSVCSLWVLYWLVGAFWNADDARVFRTFATANEPVASRLHSRALYGASLSFCVDHPHRLPEGVTSLGIGYGTFVLDPAPVRGFLDAEVQWTRNPSDAAVQASSLLTQQRRALAPAGFAL